MSEKFDPLVAEWISFVKNPNFNLIEKCLKFSQLIEYPELQVDAYIKKIHRMGMSLKESISDVKNPTYLISMLNEHLFEKGKIKSFLKEFVTTTILSAFL